MWLLLAGRLNARRRADQSVSGFVMAMRWTLVSVCWPAVLLGCVIAGVRSRLRDSTLRLVAAGRDAAVITGAQTRRELGKEAHSVKQVPRDHGVPQTAPFWVGQRIHNTYAGLGVVIAVQAKDAADSRGSLPGGRWWEIVVVFDQPYVSRARADGSAAVRTWTFNVLANGLGRCPWGYLGAAQTRPAEPPVRIRCVRLESSTRQHPPGGSGSLLGEYQSTLGRNSGSDFYGVATENRLMVSAPQLGRAAGAFHQPVVGAARACRLGDCPVHLGGHQVPVHPAAGHR